MRGTADIPPGTSSCALGHKPRSRCSRVSRPTDRHTLRQTRSVTPLETVPTRVQNPQRLDGHSDELTTLPRHARALHLPIAVIASFVGEILLRHACMFVYPSASLWTIYQNAWMNLTKIYTVVWRITDKIKKTTTSDTLSHHPRAALHGTQPFLNSSQLLATRCSHKNFMMITQTVWQSNKNRHPPQTDKCCRKEAARCFVSVSS